MRLPDEKVEEVRQAADIVEVVSEHVRLKRQGARYVGLCPFHKEKSPSFSVDPKERLFYCFGCLEEQEPVWTSRGLVPIGALRVGDTVLGLDGQPEIVTHTVTKQQPVLALELDLFRRDPLLLTADHTCVFVRAAEAERAVPMLYRQRNRGVRFQGRRRGYEAPRPVRLEEGPAEGVQPGDYFLFPVIPAARRTDAPLPTPPEAGPVAPAASGSGAVQVRKGPRPRTLATLPVNARTGWLYGLYLAEGSSYRGGVRWSFHHDEQALAARVVETLAAELGLRAHLHARPERHQLEVTCSSTYLSHALPKWFGRGAAGKTLPAEALHWTPETQRAVLDGYFAGDGSKGHPHHSRAVTVSQALAHGLFALSVQAGRPIAYSRDVRPTRAGRTVWGLNALAQESVRGFFHTSAHGTHYWLRVARVTPKPGPRTVVDITVTGSHTFTTKLGAVHNCHKGGDTITFVREVEGVGFFEAVRGLAEKYNVPLPEAEEGQDAERASRQESILHALRWAGRWFFAQLTKTAEGEQGLNYLLKRGLTPDTIKQYGLGFAPDRWDALVNAAAEAGLAPDLLVDAGLAIRRDRAVGGNAAGSLYDRYRGRVMFPIFSHTGRVIGFGGRLMTDAKDQPKYINSPETLVYGKSRVLYGLYQGRQEIRRQEEALLVEGYLDVLALHQAGFLNAVATCGTALTPEQVALVSRFAKRLVLVYDGDNAGRNAAVKGAETVVANWRVDPADEKAMREQGVGELLRKGLVVYSVSLPTGEDPDSFVRDHGGEAFREYLHKHRQDFVAFAYTSAERTGRLATPEGRAEVQGEILRTIAQLQGNPLLRESYLTRAAEVLGVPLPILAEALAQQQRTQRSRPAYEEAPPTAYDEVEEAPLDAPPEALPAEEELIRLMLQGADPLVEFVLGRMGLDEFSEGPVRALAAALIQQYEAGHVSREAFLSGQHGADLQRLAARVLAARATVSDGWKEQGVTVTTADPYEAAASAMTLLKLRRVDDALEAQKAAMRSATEAASLEAAQRRLMALLDLRKRIEARAFLDEG